MDAGKATVIAAAITGMFVLISTGMSNNQAPQTQPAGDTETNICSGNSSEGGRMLFVVFL